MRKREIHSVAHWAMMFILLMFPVLMVGLSVFQHYDESQIQTVVNNVDNVNDLKTGQTYTFANSEVYAYTNSFQLDFYVDYFKNNANDTVYECTYITFYSANNAVYLQVYNGSTFKIGFTISNSRINVSFTYSSLKYNVGNNTIVDYLTYITYIDNYNYKIDVNLWTKSFLDLPINAWYKSLMSVIGVGFTNSSVMNVIYVMPVYILWVFIFDVIVDCFLVIIKLPHKLLNRLSGGENE